MSRIFKTKAMKILGIIIGALLIGAIIATIAHSNSSPLSKAVVTATRPLQKVSIFISNSIDEFCDYFRSSSALKEENAKLKQSVADYQGELIDYENTKRKIELYEEFLGVKEEHKDFEFSSAAILSRDTSSVYTSFILDKGAVDGIELNDPVIYGKNLVGIVTDVAPASCTVKTIINPDFSAAVYESRSNQVGFVTGFDDGIRQDSCKLPGLTKVSNIASGGLICTLGIGGVFPKDLIVGTVEQIEKSKTDVSYYAVVKSNIDFSDIKEVFIITSFEGQGIEE